MDNENQIQEPEFDLDDILNEFHDIPAEETAEVEPDAELEALLQMPELTITPVVVKTPDMEELLSEDTGVIPEAALEGATVPFSPITEAPA